MFFMAFLGGISVKHFKISYCIVLITQKKSLAEHSKGQGCVKLMFLEVCTVVIKEGLCRF